jgi:hypothetical protein
MQELQRSDALFKTMASLNFFTDSVEILVTPSF